MFTIGDTGLKGEILLTPSGIERIHELGNCLAESLKSGIAHRYCYTELPDRLICPVCFSDTFHGDGKGRYRCAVCKYGVPEIQETGKSHNGSGKKISRLMHAPVEVRERLTGYFEEDRLPADDYKPAAVETEDQDKVVE